MTLLGRRLIQLVTAFKAACGAVVAYVISDDTGFEAVEMDNATVAHICWPDVCVKKRVVVVFEAFFMEAFLAT